MARPLVIVPEAGPVLTLDDLSEFVSVAFANGWSGKSTPRIMGAIERLDFNHGPRATRITLVPGEVSE